MSALKEVGQLWGEYIDDKITSENMHAEFERILALMTRPKEAERFLALSYACTWRNHPMLK